MFQTRFIKKDLKINAFHLINWVCLHKQVDIYNTQPSVMILSELISGNWGADSPWFGTTNRIKFLLV